MYCPKCGTQINEGAAFCPQCGTPISTPSQSQRAAAQEQNFQPQNFQNNEGTFNTVTPPKKKKKGLIIAIIAVFLIAGAIVTAVLLTRGRSLNKTIDTFVNGLIYEPTDMLDVMPDEAVDFLIQQSDGVSNRSELIRLFEKGYKDRSKNWEEYLGKDCEVSYEIKNITDISKNKAKREIADYYNINPDSEDIDSEDIYSEDTDLEDIDSEDTDLEDIDLEDSGVTETKKAELSFKLEGEKDSAKEFLDLILLKIDGSGYVAAINIY